MVPVTARITFGRRIKSEFLLYFAEYEAFGSQKWDTWHRVYLFRLLFLKRYSFLQFGLYDR